MRLRAQQRTMLRSIFDSLGYQISIHIWRPGSMNSGCTRAKAIFFFRLGDQRAEVAERSDHVVIISQGRVRAEGTPSEITEHASAADLEAAFVALTTADSVNRSAA